MYNEERFSFGGIIFKILLVVLFVFLLMWLFPMPNMKPVYDRIFNDNIESMKNAAKDYFTVDRLPKNVGEKKTLTLEEMLNQKLVMPYVDKDNNLCYSKSSYVEVVKMDNEYLMKVNLSCPSKTDYIVEHIGCYNLCPDNSCDKPEGIEYQFSRTLFKGCRYYTGKVTEYEFKKYKQVEDGYTESCTNGQPPVNGKCTITETKEVPLTPVDKTVYTEKPLTVIHTAKQYSAWKFLKAETVEVPLDEYTEELKKREYIGKQTVPVCTGCLDFKYVYTYYIYTRTITTAESWTCPAGTDRYEGILNTSTLKCFDRIPSTIKVCPDDTTRKVETPTLLCFKSTITTRTEDSKKTIKYKWVLIDTKWSRSKTYMDYIFTGNTRSISTQLKKCTGWVITLPEDYKQTDKKTDFKWSIEKTIPGWNPTGTTRPIIY